MIDSFGRKIDYLRFSVTDRCDLRCKYCMPLKPTFYKKSEFLSLDELKKIVNALVKIGIRKIRITGGEPLVRKDIAKFLEFLHRHKEDGLLEEILLTTNGTQLKKYAKIITDVGIKRINISLDSLVAEKYNFITNGGELTKVLDGISEAQKNNIKIKINTVLLKNFNEDEILPITKWCFEKRFKLSFIEVMPIGEISVSRVQQYLPVSSAKKILNKKFGLISCDFLTNGPSRYFKIEKLGSIVGFISPISNHFCNTCNRIRITSSGFFYGCLGDESSVDLKPFLKNKNPENLVKVLKNSIYNKPEKHFFKINDEKSKFERFMNTTGG